MRNLILIKPQFQESFDLVLYQEENNQRPLVIKFLIITFPSLLTKNLAKFH